MVEFDVLGTGATIDTSDPTGSLLTVVSLILGSAVLFMALPIGRQIASAINGQLASLTGSDVGDSSSGLTFGGD